ncbi:LysM domain-containing protein 5 [Elsinoe fawcettii]|nr:LysM domain-containing protein 5 [Elsinoe fawcettii]
MATKTTSLLIFLAAACLSTRSFAQIQFFPSDTTYENQLSSACVEALATTIQCDAGFTFFPNTDFQGPFENSSSLDNFCGQSCSKSLASYHDAVSASCGVAEPYTGVPALYAGDRMWAYQNRTCLKDPASGEYCNDIMRDWILPDNDITIDRLPKQYLCSACYLNLLQAIQATPYSNYGPSMVEPYQKAQKICGVQFPTDVLQLNSNATSYHPPGTGEPSYDETSDGPCLSGKHTVIKAGDNCQSLSEANTVSTGALRVINDLFPDCSNLVVGANICLPQSCRTYKVQTGDTCDSVAAVTGNRVSDLISYNPTLNGLCSNIIPGEMLCLSPPAGNYTPTAIPGATATKTQIYATATVRAPGPKASGTTNNCGKWYEVKSGDDCQQISVAYSIAVPLLKQINPSINSDCSNILIGFYYCIQPTADWNNVTSAPSPTVTQAPPAPTSSGTVGSCFAWHVIESGDYCGLIEDQYGISDTQFRAWNPSIDANCYNILLGFAYCVNAAPTSGASAALSSATPATS